MGVAAIAGFVTAASLVPSEQQRLRDQLEKIQEALRDRAKEAEHEKSRHDTNGNPDKGWLHGIFGFIGTEAIKLVRPILMTLLSTYLGGDKSGHDDQTDATASQTDSTPPPT
jgi:hypothetical protein